MTDKEQIIIDGKIIGCPCYIDRPLHRYDKGCLVQSQAFKEQQTEEKPILRCDEIKNCPIKENFKQLQCKTAECEELKERLERIEEDLKHQCVDCMNINSDRYRKALDEIKGLAQSMLDDFEEDSIDQKFEYCKQIGMLIETIINEVKGGRVGK